ncbi:TadE family protein [Agrococcus beijingensis]|uniref:TadE family protein n=1 Tax=Agrococcus beijingensis TaxID=3068634 RepID=UPI002741F205|nr:TadE family protein [Agrococcus sp. REN33]
MNRHRSDRGAAAVEFALVLPLLVILTFGIIFFGYAFHLQTILDNAARDAVRYYTLSEPAQASVAAQDAAAAALAPAFGSDALSSGNVTFSPALASLGCTDEEIVTVRLRYNGELPLADLFGWGTQLEGSGSMRCNG